MTGAGAIVVYDPGQCKFLFHRSSSNGCRLKLGWCDIFCHPTPQLEDRFRTSRAQQTRYSKLYSYGRKLPYLCSRKSWQPGATLLRLASILLVGCFVESGMVCQSRVISSALTGSLGSHRVTRNPRGYAKWKGEGEEELIVVEVHRNTTLALRFAENGKAACMD